MEFKVKLELLQTAVKNLIEDEKEASSSSSSPSLDSFVAVVKDGGDDNNSLLSKLLLQLETLEDGILAKQLYDEKNVPSPEVVGGRDNKQEEEEEEGRNEEEEEEECNNQHCSENGNEEIIKELRKVRKQNLVTHCLLSVMIVLTLAWQLSEVSLLLKLKDGLSHPFKSLGGVLKGMLKQQTPTLNNDNNGGGGVLLPSKKNSIVQAATTLPGLNIPHVDFPSFDFETDEN